MKQLPMTAAMALALAACATTTPSASTLASRAPAHAPIVGTAAVPVLPHPDQLALLESDDPQLEANKRLVFDFWRTVLEAGQVELAGQYLTEGYIQHDPNARNGRAAFIETMSAAVPHQDTVASLIQAPLVTIVAERDYVVLPLVDERPEPDGSGTYTSTFFHMFRIENGHIAEHWSSGQRVAGMNMPSAEEGGPATITGVTTSAEQLAMVTSGSPLLVLNKRTAFDLWRQVPDAGREELADLYLDPIYIQHNPNAETGRDGFKVYMARRPEKPIETRYEHPVVTIVGEGDLVVQVLADQRADPDRPEQMYTIAWFDMFRLQDGLIIEHWDAAAKGELRAGTLPEAQ